MKKVFPKMCDLSLLNSMFRSMVFMIVLLCAAKANALTIYHAKMTVKVETTSQGKGQVYVGTKEEDEPTYGDEKSAKQSVTESKKHTCS